MIAMIYVKLMLYIFLLHLPSFLAPLPAAAVPLACLLVLSAIQLLTYGSSASSLAFRKIHSVL